MFLTKYRPNTALDLLDNDFFRPFLKNWLETETDEDVFRLPMTNVNETDKEYILTMEMPGVEKKNVEVNVENNQLVVSGEKTEKTEVKGLLRREIRSEKFRRSFSLDTSVDHEKVKAKLDNGVLTVTLPKRAESVGRKISIE